MSAAVAQYAEPARRRFLSHRLSNQGYAGFRPTMLGLLLPVCILAVWLGRPLASFIPTADSITVQDREARALPSIARACPRSTCTIVSLGTSPALWEHFWVGGRVPSAVARFARHFKSVGLWQIYETRGGLTKRVETALGSPATVQ